MEDLISGWKAAARRADEVREKIAGLARIGVPVSRDLLVDLARCGDDVIDKLWAVRQSRMPPGSQ